MKKSIKRTISAFILVVMILSLLPVVSFAAEGDTPYTDFSYTLSGSNIILGKYNGTATTVVVPGTYTIGTTTYTTYIDSNTTFNGNTTITSVTLGSGVRFKDNTMAFAFANCTALKTIDMTQANTTGITSMHATFMGCSALTNLDVSNIDTSKVTSFYAMFSKASKLKLTGYENWNTSSVQYIGFMFNYALTSTQVLDLSKWNLSKVTNSQAAFQFCNAKDLILPDSLTILSSYALNHLTNYSKSYLTIPKGLKEIGYAHVIYDFGKNATFNEIRVAEGNTHFKSVDGVLYSMDGTKFIAMPRGKTHTNNTYEILEGVTFIPELSFSRTQKISTLVLPDSYVIRQVVPENDPEYYNPSHLTTQDANVNSGNSLSIAIYLYTSIANYEVKDSNPRYKSDRGIIYSKDMKKLLAVPLKYNQDIIVPEGVERWEADAMYVDGGGVTTSSHTVKIPASMKYIGINQLKLLNTLKSSESWTLEVDENNPTYKLDANGYIVQYGLSDIRASLSATSYAYDGTAKKPTVSVTVSNGTTSVKVKTLKNGTDYTIEYIDNVNAGTAKVKITGKGSYSGEIYKEFYIESATPYTNFTYTLDSTAKTITLTKYNGSAKTVVVPGTYTVNGTLYTTVIDSKTTFNSNTNITSATLSSGVKFKDNIMDFLFAGCTSLTNIDLSKLSTTDVTSMYATFNGCTSLTSLDLSSFDTSKVTTFYAMFTNSNKLILTGYENWDTRALTNITATFRNALKNQELDLSAWNFGKVTDSGNALNGCGASSVVLPNALSLLTVENRLTGIPNYEVSDENIYYSSDNGIIYSDDMAKLLVIPVKFNKDIVIPEGVKRWEANAFYVAEKAQATSSHKITIPASMTYIENNQLALINYLKGTKGWTIQVDENNPVYKVNANGYIVQYGISSDLISLSATSYAYDGTAKTPAVTVTATTGTTSVSTKTLTSGTDYTVEYIDNVEAGVAKVKITGKGSYSGIVYKPFNITSSVSATANELKYTKNDNDIAVEFHPEVINDIKNIEKLQLIVAYYDKVTGRLLRIERKAVRDFSNYLAESFKPVSNGECARIFIWSGDLSDMKPAHSHMMVE